MSRKCGVRQSTILLVIANLVLLTLLIVGITAPSRARSGPAALVEFDVTRVVGIVVDGIAQVTITRSTADEWRLEVPEGIYPARADRVEAFLRALADSRITREITSRDPAETDLGFDAPRAVRLRLADQDSEIVERVLEFGARLPNGSIAAAEAGVVEVEGAIDFYLTQGVTFWAYLRLLPESVRGEEVATLRIESAEGSRLLDDRPDLARALADLVGATFYAELPQTNPFTEFTLTLIDGREFRIRFYESDGDVVAVPEGPALPGEPFGELAYLLAPSTYDRLASLLSIEADSN